MFPLEFWLKQANMVELKVEYINTINRHKKCQTTRLFFPYANS